MLIFLSFRLANKNNFKYTIRTKLYKTSIYLLIIAEIVCTIAKSEGSWLVNFPHYGKFEVMREQTGE